MDDWTAREAEILTKLESRLKSDPQFDAEELEALRVLIRAYEGWQAFGWAAKWVIYSLAAIAGAIAAWDAVIGRVREWLSV